MKQFEAVYGDNVWSL